MRERVTAISFMKKHRRTVADKWAKSEVMRRDSVLKNHLPEAEMMTRKSLRKMLKQWGMVYVKPIRGGQGRGVMRVELDEEGFRPYSYQLGEKKLDFFTYKAAYRSILRDSKRKAYLVQKGIRLLRHKGRPFDIRLVVQQSPHGAWEATGTLGRVAHPRKIVTNGSQGGTIYPTGYLLRRYMSAPVRRRMLNGMDKLGVLTAMKLHQTYPGIKELGVDLALDRELKPWILEVNTLPDPCPFLLLEDQSMLRKIVRYGKAYGKTYKLNCKKAKRGVR